MNNIPYYNGYPYYIDSYYPGYNNGEMFNNWSINSSARDILSTMCHNTHHINGSIWRNGDSIRRHIDNHSNAIYNSVNGYGVMGINATNNMGRANLLATNDTAWRLNESIYRNGRDTRHLIHHSAHHTDHLINHHNSASMHNHKTTQLEIAKLQNDLQRQNIDSRGVLSAQIERARGDIMLQNANYFAELEKQNCYNTAAIQLEAYKNKAELSKQISDCECNMEALIKSQTSSTNTLINGNELQRVRDTLNSVNTENLILKNNGSI